MTQTCTCCGKEKEVKTLGPTGWWYLNGYYGITGYFCPECYEDVSHDAHKQPNHPKRYTMALLKLAG